MHVDTMSRYKYDEPLTGKALEKRIKELEDERLALLNTTENCRVGKHRTTHSEISRKYNYKIGCLRKYGFENAMKHPVLKQQAVATRRANNDIDAVTAKTQATNIERYGYANGNVKKITATKVQRFGNGYGNKTKAIDTKIRLYGDAWGSRAKIRATNIERYGYANGNVAKMRETKLAKWGNAFGNLALIRERLVELHGTTCHFNVRDKSKPSSKREQFVHDKLMYALGVNFEYAHIIDGRLYDLRYANVVVEISPTISHNSTYSFTYLSNRTADNVPIHKYYHFNKTQLALKHGYVCITIFDWHDLNDAISFIGMHLAKLPVASSDFALNPQLSDDKSTIRKHWCHLKTKEHIDDCGQDDEQMIADGYVAVYDCGHASKCK